MIKSPTNRQISLGHEFYRWTLLGGNHLHAALARLSQDVSCASPVLALADDGFHPGCSRYVASSPNLLFVFAFESCHLPNVLILSFARFTGSYKHFNQLYIRPVFADASASALIQVCGLTSALSPIGFISYAVLINSM